MRALCLSCQRDIGVMNEGRDTQLLRPVHIQRHTRDSTPRHLLMCGPTPATCNNENWFIVLTACERRQGIQKSTWTSAEHLSLFVKIPFSHTWVSALSFNNGHAMHALCNTNPFLIFGLRTKLIWQGIYKAWTFDTVKGLIAKSHLLPLHCTLY